MISSSACTLVAASPDAAWVLPRYDGCAERASRPSPASGSDSPGTERPGTAGMPPEGAGMPPAPPSAAFPLSAAGAAGGSS